MTTWATQLLRGLPAAAANFQISCETRPNGRAERYWRALSPRVNGELYRCFMKKHGEKNPAADVPDVHQDNSSDADAFEREMADVVRLPADPRGRVRAARPIPAPPAGTSSADQSGDSAGAAESGQHFAAPGVDRREIRKLGRGEYVVGDRRDLHGITAANACASVRQFIDNSRHRRYRCVCIVHGRGLHSERQTSVLKARVRECLRSHRSVLAYADAPPSDGGAGAVYVLLRK